MAAAENSKWLLRPSLALVVAAISATAVFSVHVLRKKSRLLALRVRELEQTLKGLGEKCAAERNGRVRAQQALREAMAAAGAGKSVEGGESHLYPMAPIATVQSCFSTRNGTPRQPLLVPLARACVRLDPARAPPEALEGLADYSHCWLLYVFHLNTDLEKLWREPSRSKLKAKVRVPRLRGGKVGALATRSPHRPCPIGLTVAKVEAVQGCKILLSGVDLVDGTPVLDIKPYLPYSDSVLGATVPKWLMEDKSLSVASVSFSPVFLSSLQDCWAEAQKSSLYASPNEFQSLIKQVLSWDIRSVSQRNQPHNSLSKTDRWEEDDLCCNGAESKEMSSSSENSSSDVTYHLILEGVNISYRIDCGSHVIVEDAKLSAQGRNNGGSRCNYTAWEDIVTRK